MFTEIGLHLATKRASPEVMAFPTSTSQIFFQTGDLFRPRKATAALNSALSWLGFWVSAASQSNSASSQRSKRRLDSARLAYNVERTWRSEWMQYIIYPSIYLFIYLLYIYLSIHLFIYLSTSIYIVINLFEAYFWDNLAFSVFSQSCGSMFQFSSLAWLSLQYFSKVQSALDHLLAASL